MIIVFIIFVYYYSHHFGFNEPVSDGDHEPEDRYVFSGVSVSGL
jgi:hypothetical protein